MGFWWNPPELMEEGKVLDMACHGCVGVVAEPPVHDVVVDCAGLNVI